MRLLAFVLMAVPQLAWAHPGPLVEHPADVVSVLGVVAMVLLVPLILQKITK